jgi:hypothetical protein
VEDYFGKLVRAMSKQPGATESALSTLEEQARVGLPNDYLAFLRWRNGAEGAIGPNYLVILSAEEIAEDPYPWEAFVPDVFFIASDGGEALFGFDTRIRPMPIVITHQDDLDPAGFVAIAASFTAFLEFLSEHDWIEFWLKACADSRE